MRTLVLKWTETHEWRVPVRDDMTGPSAAIEHALRESGIMVGGRPNVDATSIRFEYEE